MESTEILRSQRENRFQSHCSLADTSIGPEQNSPLIHAWEPTNNLKIQISHFFHSFSHLAITPSHVILVVLYVCVDEMRRSWKKKKYRTNCKDWIQQAAEGEQRMYQLRDWAKKNKDDNPNNIGNHHLHVAEWIDINSAKK